VLEFVACPCLLLFSIPHQEARARSIRSKYIMSLLLSQSSPSEVRKIGTLKKKQRG